jgi:hypothetical protein
VNIEEMISLGTAAAGPFERVQIDYEPSANKWKVAIWVTKPAHHCATSEDFERAMDFDGAGPSHTIEDAFRRALMVLRVLREDEHRTVVTSS